MAFFDDTDNLHRATAFSAELKKLCGVMEKVARSDNRFGVNVYDAEDREAELAATSKYLSEQKQIALGNG